MMNKMKLYCKVTYDTMVGSEDDDGDGSDYSGFSHEVYYNHRFVVSTEPIKYPDATYEITDENCVVWLTYSSSETFGTTEGYVHMVGAFKYEDALIIKSLIEKSKELDDRYEYNHELPEVLRQLESLGVGKYHPWVGYFSDLEEVYIEKSAALKA